MFKSGFFLKGNSSGIDQHDPIKDERSIYEFKALDLDLNLVDLEIFKYGFFKKTYLIN